MLQTLISFNNLFVILDYKVKLFMTLCLYKYMPVSTF